MAGLEYPSLQHEKLDAAVAKIQAKFRCSYSCSLARIISYSQWLIYSLRPSGSLDRCMIGQRNGN